MKRVNAVVAIGALAAILPASAHALNRFGVVCVKNKTDVTVFYRHHVGKGEWREDSLRPGWNQAFAHKYDRPDENRSPELDIQFDSDLRTQKRFDVTYKLPRRPAAGDSCAEGAQYQFEYDRGNRGFIDLKKVP